MLAVDGFTQEADAGQIDLGVDGAHQHDRDRIGPRAQAVGQGGAIEARHLHIREHQIDGVPLDRL
jgi:hypothetical protein